MMSMNIETPGVHHLALRVADLERSRTFYAATLGFPVILEGPGVFLFLTPGSDRRCRAWSRRGLTAGRQVQPVSRGAQSRRARVPR